jgi:hypothetical protein
MPRRHSAVRLQSMLRYPLKDAKSLNHCKFLSVAISEISGSGVGVADCSVRARSLRLDYLIRCGVGSCKQNILWLPLS